MVLERNEDCEYLECLDFSQWQQLDNMASDIPENMESGSKESTINK